VEAFEPPVKTPFSVAIKAVFHVAARIADECGDPLVDTMHVLLGVLKEETNIGSQVLARAGISYARVREFASEVLEPELSPEDFTVGPEASRASVERLRFLLSETYHCDVVHLETKIVAVAPGEEEVCNGIVEMFRMVGHPEVTGAFAWEKVSVNGGVPKVSVFQIPMSQEIQTPSEAITSEYRHRKAFMG
jgi:hypothetical protein